MAKLTLFGSFMQSEEKLEMAEFLAIERLKLQKCGDCSPKDFAEQFLKDRQEIFEYLEPLD